MRLLALLVALSFAVAACSTDLPTTALQSDESDSGAKSGAIKTVEVMEWDATGVETYLECLNETVTGFGVLDWEQTTIETPSGRLVMNGRALYSQPYGFASSDHTWLLFKATQNFHDRTTPAGDYSYHVSLHEWYENEVGDGLFSIGIYGFKLDGEGNLKFEKFHGWCPGAPDAEFSYF